MPKQLTDRGGLGRAYGAENDRTIIDITIYIYIAGRRLGDLAIVMLYYEAANALECSLCSKPIQVFHVRNARPALCKDLARKVDTAAPYASMALKTIPLLAPEYSEAAMTIDESLCSVLMGLMAVPYVANTGSSIAKTVYNVLRFRKMR